MKAPLPVRNGLGPTRVRIPTGEPAQTALQLITTMVMSQRHRHPDDDDDKIKARFLRGEVVDAKGHRLSPHSVVLPGRDIYFYRIPAPETPVPYGIRTIYEDEKLLIIDKPPYLATMPRGQHIVESATVRLRRMTGNNDLVPAHRLDRMTSGILMFTKSPEYRGPYQTLFSNRAVEKTYEAIAAFKSFDTPTQWASRISKTPGQYQAKTVEGEPNAITDLKSVTELSDDEQVLLQTRYNTSDRLGRYVLHPVTGKTHQLRLHMFNAGVPILGDTAYPTPLPAHEEDMNRPLLLRATGIAFTDPIDNTHKHFTI